MKKVFSFVMAVAVIATALGISVGSVSAAGSSVVLYLPGVTQQELKNASMFVNSEYHKVECTLKDAETGKVVCHVPGKYAGESVQIFLSGQVFSATVSAVRTGNGKSTDGEEEALTCTEPQYPGAHVTFYAEYWKPESNQWIAYTFGRFIEGETMSEVEAMPPTSSIGVWLNTYMTTKL